MAISTTAFESATSGCQSTYWGPANGFKGNHLLESAIVCANQNNFDWNNENIGIWLFRFHYILPTRILVGSRKPSFSRSIRWCSDGLAMHLFRISCPESVGSTTYTNRISDGSKITRLGSSPKPAFLHNCPSVFQRTYDKKNTKMCALTRSSL